MQQCDCSVVISRCATMLQAEFTLATVTINLNWFFAPLRTLYMGLAHGTQNNGKSLGLGTRYLR